MYNEIYISIKNNLKNSFNLISKQDWFNYIDNIKKSINIEINDEDLAINILKKPLQDSIKKRIPNKRFGLFFSGGIDSSLIAFLLKKNNSDFICYTVGFSGSKDIEYSKKVAEYYNFNHKIKEITLDEAGTLFKQIAKILDKELNIINLGVASVELSAIELAKKDNINIFFSGLGSEEIFAGYNRHEKSLNINQECFFGLKTMYDRDFKREYLISKKLNVKLLTPFLDPLLIYESMKISGFLKIKQPYKKYILRKLALNLGFNEDFSFRQKIAAQYGSNFDKAIQN